MTTYRLTSVKRNETLTGTLADAIARAGAIDAEYQPAFGVQVEDAGGETVYDTEDDDDAGPFVVVRQDTLEGLQADGTWGSRLTAREYDDHGEALTVAAAKDKEIGRMVGVQESQRRYVEGK